MPGPSDAQKAVEEFQRLMVAQDARASASVVRAYAPVYRQLQRDTRELVRIAQERGLKPWQVGRMDRMKDLNRQFLASTAKFADAAGDTITNSQRAAVGLARRGAEQTVAAGLPPGVSMENLANVGLGWNRLPEEAFTNFVGIAADGKPLGNLLAPLGPEAAEGIKDAIGTGIATGKGPRQTAELVRVAAGIPLSKALLITRTETNRAFREATRLQYANNSQVVKGYRRLAAQSDRTCIACIALDGTLYALDEPLNEHPNGRCALVPDTITYQDLGLDVEMPPQPEDARGWLARQPEADQNKILGPERLRAYKAKEIELSQLYTVKPNTVWGDAAVVTPLKDIVTKSGMPLNEWLAATKVTRVPLKKPRKPKAVPPQPKPAPSRFSKAAEDLDALHTSQLGDPVSMPITSNAQILSATPEGEELLRAVTLWSSGENAPMRIGAQKWMEGKTRFIEGMAEDAGVKIGEAASIAPRINQPVYRGIRVRRATIDEVEELYPKGKVYDAHISSFSTRDSIAEKFAGKGIKKIESPTDEVSVIFDLEPGARGLNIEPISSYIGEAERIVSGRFEVIGTRRVVTPNVEGTGREGTRLHVNIRQITPLFKEAP